jgi:hypothetical protein
MQIIENPGEIKKREQIETIKTAYKNYLQAIDQYIAFFEEKFDGTAQENIKKLHEQFQLLQKKLENGALRMSPKDLAAHFDTICKLKLNCPGNQPFCSLSELFYAEMLFLHAVEKNLRINEVQFEVFKRHAPLTLGLASDMYPICEALLAKFANSPDRSGKQLFVASVAPSILQTRYDNFSFPRYISVPDFIKIACRSVIP